MTEPALRKSIYHFGRPATMACDGNCRKAWGVSKRPSHPLPDARDEDDDEFLADGELPDAPEDPGTYEGDHAKPTRLDQRLNKWCLRECERSAWADGHDREFLLDDHSERIPNRYDRKSERQMAAVRSRGRHATTADPAETAPDLRARLEAAERRADEAEARLRELDAAAFDAMLATAYGAPACIFGELGAMTVRGLARMQTLDSDVQRYCAELGPLRVRARDQRDALAMLVRPRFGVGGGVVVECGDGAHYVHAGPTVRRFEVFDEGVEAYCVEAGADRRAARTLWMVLTTWAEVGDE